MTAFLVMGFIVNLFLPVYL